MSIGLKIKQLRKQKGWSQEKLGEAIKVSKGQISLYENNENTPPMDKIEKLAKVLGVSISEIADPESLDKLNKSPENESIHDKYIKALERISELNEEIKSGLRSEKDYLTEIRALEKEVVRLKKIAGQ